MRFHTSLRWRSLLNAAPIAGVLGFGGPCAAQEVIVTVPALAVEAPAAALAGQVQAASPKSTDTPTTETPEAAAYLKVKLDRSAAGILSARKLLASNPPPEKSPEHFGAHASAGNWKEVGAILKRLPEGDAVKIYEHVLKEVERVQAATTPGQNQGQQAAGPPAPTLTLADISELLAIAPKLDEPQLKLAGAALARILQSNPPLDALLVALEQGSAHVGGSDPAKREVAAQLLINANRSREAARFLAPLPGDRATASAGLLEKHALCTLAQGREEQSDLLLQRAWETNAAILAQSGASAEQRDRAWRRCSEIARFLPAGSIRWDADFFARDVVKGANLLSAIAVQTNADRTQRDVGARQKNLGLQQQIADALLAAQATTAEQWRSAIELFALGWVEEAEYAKRIHVPTRPPGIQYDEFGNRIYQSGPTMGNQNQFPGIPIPELLPLAPGEKWLARVSEPLRARILTNLADLCLKTEDDVTALNHIERLAPLHRAEALRAANELLRVWSNTHDPQRGNFRRTNTVYYVGGSYTSFNTGQGIPLTRALQERNLGELAVTLERLRKLPIDALDDTAVVNAFTVAHSQAEVFREESIERVLGKIDTLSPKTLWELLHAMRQRLAGQWRKPAVQQQAKTQRADAQIDAEVMRGYELLGSMVDRALERQPDDWHINLVKAAMSFDWAEFQYGKKVELAIYVEKRETAFGAFKRAAALYANQLPSMPRKDESALPFHLWLNANLGASDLALVTRQQEPSAKQIAQIRDGIVALPGGAAERHFDLLAKAVTEGGNSLPAHLKPAYMRAALQVVGSRPAAKDIENLVTYYDGLLRELEVSTRVDGDTTVGHTAPFGMFLTVRHTAEIERENAGGFSKYLRNQTQSPYYSMYGIAPVDHRDDLEKQIREKLSEGFEVLSVTFHDEKVQSRGYKRPGWRETPLVYVLLKARDASVDRIPSLRLDLDFVDKFGPAVLPVESPVQLIDARPAAAPFRVLSHVECTQLLDARTLAEGKLALEVKVTANGIIPAFEDLFDFSPEAGSVTESTDSGPAVTRFDSSSDELAAGVERTWLFKLATTKDSSPTMRFAFPRLKLADAKVAYKRYEDADLVEVSSDVALAGFPLRSTNRWWWLIPCTVCAVAVPWAVARRRRGGAKLPVACAYELPQIVTPFTTLRLLKQMHEDGALAFSSEARAELQQSIAKIEAEHFSPHATAASTPNLEAISRTWIERSRVRL